MEETVQYKGHTISIERDEDPINPRENDNMGKMVCFHDNYVLGDKHDLKHDDFSGWDELKSYLVKELGAVIILPLYLYDHSGITMRTSPFSCRWDSGQVGFIYASKETVIKEWKVCNKRTKAKVEKYLEGEVKSYDKYITGEAYGFIIDEHGESCCGYEEEDDCLEEAKSVVDHIVEKERQTKIEKVKAFIRNHVPLDRRVMA